MTKKVEYSNSKISEKDKLRLLKEENKRLREKRAHLISEIILFKTILSVMKKNKF